MSNNISCDVLRSALFAAVLAAILTTPLRGQTVPPNDDCVNAIQIFDGINPGAPAGLSGFTFNNINATEAASGLSCLAGTQSTSDVWFVYVATASGPCAFQTCTPAGFTAGTLDDTILEVYDVCGGIRLSCDDDACFLPGLGASTSTNVVAGVTYVVRLSSWSATNTVEGTFYLSVAPVGLTPGDDCATSTAFIFTDGIYQGTTAGATANPLPPLAPVCTALLGTNVDVWFYYTAPGSGLLSISREGTDSTINNGLDVNGADRMEFADASFGCQGWPSTLLCSTAASGLFTASVTSGTLYALGFGVAPGAQQGVFTFSLSLALGPANDECAVPTPVVDGTNPLSGQFSNNLATDSPGFTATCAGGPAGSKDVWFQYLASATGTVVATTCTPIGLAAGSLADTILEVYSSTCVAGAPLACNDDDPACGTGSTVSFAAVQGNVYNLRVASKSTTAQGTFYLTLSPAPGNDECSAPTPLALGANGPFFHLGATTSVNPAPTCAASNTDVWFSYTAPVSGTIRASTCGTNFDSTLAVYAGCGGTQVACDDNDATNRGPCAVSQTNAAFVRFNALAGVNYLFRLGAASPLLTGTSFLDLSYEFSFVVAPNPGASTVTLSNVAATPNGSVLNVVTLNGGAYPNGWLHGIDIPWFELFTLVAIGSPFFVPTSPAGTFVQTLGGSGYPAGLTFYCLGIDLGTAGAPIAYTDPFSVTL